MRALIFSLPPILLLLSMATAQPAGTADNIDAQLPPGINLDWENANVSAVNAKRSRLNLSGTWRFTPAAEGMSQAPKTGWGYIKVPGSWQNGRNGSTDFAAKGRGPVWDIFDGTKVARAWYERQIRVPAEWRGRTISLHFDRVSTDAIVYVNDIECGKIAWPWGSAEITRAVTPGQIATVRVLVAAIPDAEQVGRFWQNALSSEITFSAAPLRSRGLTGNVFLESRPSEATITDVYVRTSTRKKEVSLDVDLAAVVQAGPIHCVAEMLNEKGEVEKTFTANAVVAARTNQTLSLSWSWENPRLWDVGQPNLYTTRLTITGAGVDDQFDQPFGFREFWIEGRDFFLNGTIVRLRQPCFYSGPRGQVGDIFSEMGSESVDTRGDLADSTRNLSDADRNGYLVAQYVLNANKYLMNSRRQLGGGENQMRALERAEVWMHHYRNHPSIVMWIAGFNFFNNAVDADPRHIGRKNWAVSDERWQRLMVLGREMFDGLKKLDPARVYYSHSGAYTGDIYTMNCYLDLIPLQEREDWLSAWAENGEMPVSMVEFGTPMDCTFRRGRHGFESNITSEPLLTEFAAIYFGAGAYSAEEAKYRDYLHDLFKSGMLYGSSENRLDDYANNHKIQQLYRLNTWRSWRTAGLPGGLRTWSWMQDALKEVNGPTLAWIAGPANAFTAKDHSFSAGQEIQKQIVLINDTRQPQNFNATWSTAIAGNQIGHGETKGTLAVSEIRFLPIRFTLPASQPGDVNGEIKLAANIGPGSHTDAFAFREIGGGVSANGPLDVVVVDQNDLTRRMLERLGYNTRPWTGGDAPLVVIGRNAMQRDAALAPKLETFVRNGGRALMFSQDPDWMTQALGFRVCPKVTRRVFPIESAIKDSSLAKFDAEDFRDWNGDSSLLEAYPEYTGNYLRGNEREQPYAGWHWGNRGGVSSAAVEKPHRSGWRPLLECEFDLAYSPLMELDCGKGRLILCTLDLEDHTDLDPAARTVAIRLLDYALHSPLSPRANKVVYLGGASGAQWLEKIGVTFEPASTLNENAGLTLIGPDAVIDSKSLSEYVEKGGKVFFLPRAGSNDFFGATLKPAPEKFAGSLSAPDWPEARGLSPSDLRWRTHLDSPPWILNSGAEIGANGLIARKNIGQSVAVFCQIDPTLLRADEKTYFRYTRWRATRAVAQLLANLGATFAVDDRTFQPLETWAVNLDGPWKMQVTMKLPPAANEATAPPDPGISSDAKKLLEGNFANDKWISVTLPQMLPFFKDNDGEAVFEKEIIVPANRAGKDLNLFLGALADFDITAFNHVEIGHTDAATPDWRLSPREYRVPGNLVKAGTNVISVRLFNRFGPGGFSGRPGLSMAPDGDRSGTQATGSRLGLEMRLSVRPQGSQSRGFYHPDYRTDFPMGDNPYRYYRW
jgi:beta-galactosidase